MTPSDLHKNLNRVLDEVLETGVPIAIEHKGETLWIVPERPRKKLDNLKARDCLQGDPEGIVDVDWLQEWRL